MFTANDEEIRQIKQPMECLIERTNHKCKRCTSEEAMLKQHHCELPIKKEKSHHCIKTINRPNNLEKLLRSCEKTPTHTVKRQLRQTALNGPPSSKNGPSTPKKFIVEEVQVSGSPAEHAEHWKTPEIVESP